MTPTTIARCLDCTAAAPPNSSGWLRCPSCDSVFCSDCAAAHRDTSTGECDSTAACTVCAATCLIDL